MPHHVRAHSSLHPGPFCMPPQSCAHGLLRKPPPMAVMEEVPIPLHLLLPKRTMALGGSEHLRVAELQHPLPPAFPQNLHPSLLQVHILILEVAHLCNASSGGEKDLQDGDVPNQRLVGVGVPVGVVALQLVE